MPQSSARDKMVLKECRIIQVMMACNESYAAPLSVTALSLMRNIKKDRKVYLYIIDFNMLTSTQNKIKESLNHYVLNGVLELHFLPLSDESYTDPTYGRLLGMVDFIQRIDLHAKYIYLDADLLIRHDISELWDECQQKCEILNASPGVFAVQDYGYPNGHEKLESIRELFRGNGFSVQENRQYYNAGVFFVDMDVSEEQSKNQLVTHLKKIICIAEEWDDERKKKKVTFADQDILNIFFKINPLEKKWNVQGIGSYMKDRCEYQHQFFPKLFSSEEYTQLVSDPYIVHFTGSDKLLAYFNMPGKPWNPMCKNPFKHEFLMYQNQTDFKGDPIADATDMTSELNKDRDLVHFIHSVNRTVKNHPTAFDINFHFVRHSERQCFYRGGEDSSWSPEFILNNGRLHDDGLTGFGKVMAHVSGEKISEVLKDNENGVVLIFSSPFIRCLETAIEIYDSVKEASEKIKVLPINVDRGLSEYLKEEWFGKALENLSSSKIEDLFLNVDELEKKASRQTQNNNLFKEHSILPPHYQLRFEGDDSIDGRFMVMARCILDEAYNGYGLGSGKDKISDVIFVSHGVCLERIIKGMLDITASEDTTSDFGPIRCAHHCHFKYNYLSSELQLIAPFSTPTYTTPHQNWNDNVVGDWKKLFGRITKEDGKEINILEIGSWEGLSASRFLTMVPGCKLWCIDHFDELKSEAGKERLKKFLYNTRVTGRRQHVKLIIGFSFSSLLSILKPGVQFDFSYIDGSHRADDTFLDAEMVWRMSKKNSLMLFDDYEWPTKSTEYPNNPETIDSIEHPKKGIDAFISLHKDELEVVSKGYQICVRKNTHARLGFPIGQEVVKCIPLMHFLNSENMMEKEENGLFEYIVMHVQEQYRNNPNNIVIFDFSM